MHISNIAKSIMTIILQANEIKLEEISLKFEMYTYRLTVDTETFYYL